MALLLTLMKPTGIEVLLIVLGAMLLGLYTRPIVMLDDKSLSTKRPLFNAHSVQLASLVDCNTASARIGLEDKSGSKVYFDSPFYSNREEVKKAIRDAIRVSGATYDKAAARRLKLPEHSL